MAEDAIFAIDDLRGARQRRFSGRSFSASDSEECDGPEPAREPLSHAAEPAIASQVNGELEVETGSNKADSPHVQLALQLDRLRKLQTSSPAPSDIEIDLDALARSRTPAKQRDADECETLDLGAEVAVAPRALNEDLAALPNVADAGAIPHRPVKVGQADFELCKVIGRGAYGKVFMVKKRTGRDEGQV